MKKRIVNGLSFSAKALSVVVGFKAVPLFAVIPAESKAGLAAAFIFAIASTAKDGVKLTLDFMDDGKLNNSAGRAFGLLLAFLLPAFLLASCTNGWEVKFQDKAGITPGQAVGLVGNTMDRYADMKKANHSAKPADPLPAVEVTSGKEPVNVEPGDVVPVDSPGDTPGGWLGILKMIWSAF